jgi:DNA invertase Pin-like site-specific DNA recombinase
MKTEQAKVIGYVRVSTDKQDVSLESQEQMIRAMGVVKGWELGEIIVDRDEFSGDMDRPGLQRVLEMVRAKQIGAVIVTKLDRLTRSTCDAILMIDLFNKKKTTLVSLAESLDTKSAMGRFFVRMIASLAELERETIGDRTRTALGHLKNLGMPVGPAPYGYRTQRSNRLVPLAQKLPPVEDSAEQAILHQVRGLRAGGMSLREIAAWLNEQGHKTRRGTEWRFQYVARMLNENRNGIASVAG